MPFDERDNKIGMGAGGSIGKGIIGAIATRDTNSTTGSWIIQC